MPESIRHLSLDLWLTLIRSNKAFKPARNVLFMETFNLQQSPEEVLRVFQEYDQIFNSINEKTGRNFSTSEMLYVLLSVLGKDISQIPLTEINEFMQEAEKLFFNYPPEVLEGTVTQALQAVRSNGISISLLSNTAFIRGETLRKLLPKLGFEGVFDFHIFSDEENFSKPSPQIFASLFNQALQIWPDIKASQILHIGDNSVADFQGAISAGFKAHLFNPTTDSLSNYLSNTLCTPLSLCTT